MGIDISIIGAGPNGLTTGILLARKGFNVTIYEAADEPGGGARTGAIIRDGYYHDICSAVFPLGIASPVFNTFPLQKYGLEWINPAKALAHVFKDRPPVILHNSIEETSIQFGSDKNKYAEIFSKLVNAWSAAAPDLLGPLKIPQNLRKALNFGRYGILPAKKWADVFSDKGLQALIAGIAGHVPVSQNSPFSAAPAMVLHLAAHLSGWPLARGGAGAITRALAEYFKDLGGKIELSHPVKNIDELPDCDAVVFDITPKQIVKIAGDKLPLSINKKLSKFRYGPAVYKMDFILKEPVPFRHKETNECTTVHIGGYRENVTQSINTAYKGKIPDELYMILSQPSLFDRTRLTGDGEILWAYTHVPKGYDGNISEHFINNIEIYAPGFREVITDYKASGPVELENYNSNYVSGDIMGGTQDFFQFFTRPFITLNPYRLVREKMYICSSSTPPGGGVHGMCGFQAARTVLNDFQKRQR